MSNPYFFHLGPSKSSGIECSKTWNNSLQFFDVNFHRGNSFLKTIEPPETVQELSKNEQAFPFSGSFFCVIVTNCRDSTGLLLNFHNLSDC